MEGGLDLPWRLPRRTSVDQWGATRHLFRRYAFKRSQLIALRPSKITAESLASEMWPGASGTERMCKSALGHAATAADRWPAGDKHPQ